MFEPMPQAVPATELASGCAVDAAGVADPPRLPGLPADPLAAFLDEAAGFEPAPDGPLVERRDLDGLEDVVPGAALALALEGLEPADLSDEALLEVAAAAERLRSWAFALQARTITELTLRAGGSGVTLDGVSASAAARLCLTGRSADLLVGMAAGLGDLPEVADALGDGRIDERRARTLVDGSVDVPREDRRRLVAPLVGTRSEPGPACRLTAPRVRERVRRAVAAYDPAGADRRRERARAERCVRFEPAGDAMAYLSALLPAGDAAGVRAHLDALAVPAQRAPGEVRTLDQLRADTLVALLTGARPVEHRRPDPCEAAPEASPAATEGAATEGVATGGVALDDVAMGDAVVDGVAWTAPTVRTVVHVTVAASTLLGLDDEPGELRGFGPIPASLARGLASGPNVTWQRILTDPATGVATDVSRRTYRPGVVLGDLVRARDETCTFPGCRVPAWRCDLGHVEPFDHASAGAEPRPPGQTRADNLHPVCRRHHNLKTHGAWSTVRDPASGRVTWGAPSGHDHVVGAHVVDRAHACAALGDGEVETSRPAAAGRRDVPAVPIRRELLDEGPPF
ncbi:DUF222 domain-containing protein [Luteimicrobium album]|nr:HNH endonuclease signature motif containing protein [Luteimicrobium album]